MNDELTGYVCGSSGFPQLVHRPKPAPGPREVLVRVHAFGVNRADLLQLEGKHPPPAGVTDILGLEAAGEVELCGSGVDTAWIGKRICFLLSGGGYANYAIVPIEQAFEMPGEWSYSYGAAIPETFLTAFLNLFLHGEAKEGESLLIHGGGSGVGTAGIQLAKATGVSVYVTAGSDEKCSRCTELGASGAINYREKDFAEEIKALRNGEGIDLILDCMGASYFKRNMELLRTKGRLVCIALQGGSKTEIDLRPLLSRRLTVIGSVLRTRTDREKAYACSQFKARFWQELTSGKVKPVIDAEFDWAELDIAHERMRKSLHFGKIIVKVQ